MRTRVRQWRLRHTADGTDTTGTWSQVLKYRSARLRNTPQNRCERQRDLPATLPRERYPKPSNKPNTPDKYQTDENMTSYISITSGEVMSYVRCLRVMVESLKPWGSINICRDLLAHFDGHFKWLSVNTQRT